MADPLEPYQVAINLLQAVRDYFTDHAVPLPSQMTAIAGSLPAWDTDQLTVALQRLPIGLPGMEEPARPLPAAQASITAELQVQLVRKASATLAGAPRRTLPTAAQLDSDAQMFMSDVVALHRALAYARRHGLITGTVGGRPEPLGKVKISAVTAAEQQGEYLGLGAIVSVLLG